MNDNGISLTDLPRRLREIIGGTVPVPTYRVLYARCSTGLYLPNAAMAVGI